MKKLVEKFLRDEQGLELSEYAVMTALIVATLIGVIVALREQIEAAFTRVTGAIAP